MVTNWKYKILKYWRAIGVAAGESSSRPTPVHLIFLIAGALIFFFAEFVIEQWLFDNDFVVDALGAATGALALLLFRSAILNARLYRELKRNTEGLERRIAEIAHEFQTPLAVLKCNLAELEGASTTKRESWAYRHASYAATRNKALTGANETIDRLSRLVNTMLEISRLRFAPNHARAIVDIAGLARAMHEDFSPLAEDRGITLRFEEKSEHLPVSGDADKLTEVFMNLISNAIKHTPPGGTIAIRVGAVENGAAVISITDTGSGIASDDLPHIFERFYRIGGCGNAQQGTGLGLHLSRQIVEAYNGTITAESKIGEGSCFTVTLPVVQMLEPKPAGRFAMLSIASKQPASGRNKAPESASEAVV